MASHGADCLRSTSTSNVTDYTVVAAARWSQERKPGHAGSAQTRDSSSSASSSNVSTYSLVVAVADLAMLVERKQEILSESNDVHNTILYGACLQLLRQHLYFCTSKAS